MSTNTFRFLGTAIGLIVIIIGAWWGIHALPSNQPASAAASLNTPIKIGFIGPLSGNVAEWGEAERNALELAVVEINTAGGINGRQIELLSEDSKCNGKDAVSAAQKLITADRVGILMVTCSAEALAVAPIANERRVLVLTLATASTVTHAGDYVFRSGWRNADMASVMAKETYGRTKRAAIISEQSEFAVDLHKLFKSSYADLGGAIVADEVFPQGSRDIRTQVTKVLAEKPEVVAINPDGAGTGIAVLKQLKELGYSGRVVGNFFGDSTEVESAPEAKGMIYVGNPSIADTPEKRAFLENYKTKFGTYPSFEWPAVARHDAMYIIAQAIAEIGDDPTAIKDYLYAMDDFTGLLGTYSFDENGDVVGIQPTVATIE